MGFRLADRIDLVFTGKDGNPLPAYDECEITVRAMSIDDYATMMDLVGRGIEPTKDDDDRLRALLGMFLDTLVDWNLENADGAPTPRTVDALLTEHPKTLAFVILNTWRDAQTEGPVPFAPPSSDGAPLAEIPVESLAS